METPKPCKGDISNIGRKPYDYEVRLLDTHSLRNELTGLADAARIL